MITYDDYMIKINKEMEKDLGEKIFDLTSYFNAKIILNI